MKRILVTGGAGFIGSHIVQGLLKAGNSVHVLDNLTSGYRENIPSEARFFEGDIRDLSVFEAALQGCDGLINLAASVGNKRSIDNPIEDAEINIIGFLNLLQLCLKHEVNQVVHSSSAGVFGELKTLPISEDHPLEPESPYGVSKLTTEYYAQTFMKLYPQLRIVCLRYFNVYGPHQRFDEYGNVIPIFVKRALAQEPILIYGDGEQTRDFVHVKDVAQANITALKNDKAKGAYNISSGTRISINALARWVKELSQSPSPIVHGETRPGDVRDSLADISQAKQDFGFQPQYTADNLKEGLREYIQWVEADPIMGELLK